MVERVKADGSACMFCAARTLTAEGAICETWRLGQRNRSYGKQKRRFGISIGSGTAMRPSNCPHPDGSASTTSNVQTLLRKKLNR